MARARKGHTRPSKNKRNQKKNMKMRKEQQKVLESLYNKK